ncbi:hypothetical protein EV426DRAFT_538829 [Tirmania nivea]|nr:hypothetical protein EV426DRAFT_538829 [Tirmania nivea]
MNIQAGPAGNGVPQLTLDDVTVRGAYFPDIPRILPHERVFPIQIGSEMFKLRYERLPWDGQFLFSRAPSYFSQFFEQQLASDPDAQVRTLYIDRDPVTFRDIARHLQGYYVSPEDAGQYVRLFADAQFYSLPKLISQLYESDFYIFIGGTHFRIPRDIFSNPGDSSNFFGLNLSVNFTKSDELFPGLPREGLLRPPSIAPANVPNHSPETFKELLHVLRGYPIQIRNEEHRQELLQDCRYYNLRCLEQKLIPHSISYNLRRDRHEIVIRIEDIKPSRITFRQEIYQPNQTPPPDAPVGFVVYGRPWVDDEDYELVVEIGGETTKFDRKDMRVEFVGQTNRRITNFLQRIADKLNLATTQPLGLQMMAQAQQAAAAAAGAAGSGLPPSPGNTPLSEDRVKVRIDCDAHIILDGEEVEWVPWVPYGGNEDDGSIVSEDRLIPGNAYQLNLPNIPPPPRPSSGGSPNVVSWAPPHPPASHQQTSPLQNRAHPPPPPRPLKRRRGRQGREWIIKRGQWRVRVQRTSNSDGKGGMEVVLCAVKLEAFSGELGRNMGRVFLA